MGVLAVGVAASAQVLARPGWAGSGVEAEVWWRRGVFYRITPRFFQDSNGDGVGDLAGVEQRLDYLQRLGVDAIILVPPFNEDDFGLLARKAADAHVRILVELPAADEGLARKWLNQGAAGVVLRPQVGTTVDGASLQRLRKQVASFPGDRVLIADGRGVVPVSGGAQLREMAVLGVGTEDARALRSKLDSALLGSSDGVENVPLLHIEGEAQVAKNAQAQALQDRVIAAAALGSRAAVIFDAGRELGLISTDGSVVAMQWTPANVTSETPQPVVATKPKVEVYGAFTPYIPPPKLALPAPTRPVVVQSETAQPSDLNTLPGFSTAEFKVSEAVNGAASNAASEETDESSLLNFYRHLIALHHGNWSIRNGSQTLLNRDAQNVLVWVRRAPAGTRTTASVLIAANLSEQPASLDLQSDLQAMRVRAGVLRPLLTASVSEMLASAGNLLPTETADHLVLPGRTFFMGELYHEGAAAPSSTSPRRHRRRR